MMIVTITLYSSKKGQVWSLEIWLSCGYGHTQLIEMLVDWVDLLFFKKNFGLPVWSVTVSLWWMWWFDEIKPRTCHFNLHNGFWAGSECYLVFVWPADPCLVIYPIFTEKTTHDWITKSHISMLMWLNGCVCVLGNGMIKNQPCVM